MATVLSLRTLTIFTFFPIMTVSILTPPSQIAKGVCSMDTLFLLASPRQSTSYHPSPPLKKDDLNEKLSTKPIFLLNDFSPLCIAGIAKLFFVFYYFVNKTAASFCYVIVKNEAIG